MQFEPIYRKTFNNGLVLLSERTPWSERVEINIGIKVGSAYELPEEEGVAHFLEHLMWKRENRRETKKRSLFQDRHVIQSNATTGKEITNFTISAPKNKLKVAFNTAFKDLQNYTFNSKEFGVEKDVVLTEVKKYSEDDDDFGYCQIAKLLFNDTSLENPIEGRYEKVAELTKEKVISFKQKWYTPNNMIVSVVGNFNQNELEDLIAHTLGSLSSKNVSRPSIILPSIKNKEYSFKRESSKLTHFHVGFQPSRVDLITDEYLRLIDGVLSMGESSILFQEFREKEGLVYSIDSNVFGHFEDIVFFYFNSECESHKAKTAENKLEEVFDSFSKGNFSKRRFLDARNLWKNSLSKRLLEHLSYKASTLLISEYNGDKRDYRSILKRIDRMNYDVAREYSREFFSKPYVMVKLVPA